MLLTVILLVLNVSLLLTALVFMVESFREHEPRAPWVGAAWAALHLVLTGFILWAPWVRFPLALLFGLGLALGLVLLIPPRKKARSLKGALGYAAGDPELITPFDEREVVFARNRGLKPGMEEYRRYYEAHPEHKAYDDKRRERGGPLGRPGSIDHGHRPNVAMLKSSFLLADFLGPQAVVEPEEAAAAGTYAQAAQVEAFALSPERASQVVKGWARHLGADLVGICRTDPRWAYSHRGEIHYGNWEDWGRAIQPPLPYTVVIATRMDHRQTGAAPHTPTVVESGLGYAKGAYVTTILAQWFGAMGYRATAEHNRHYDSLMVPLAVEAGLGELGRQGYLIADKFGAAVRLFACQTDMPLLPDRPKDLGAEEFCRRCLKCALACPSGSIPLEREQTVSRGLLRWELDQESCFDYWGKVGTDCCICMAICPFSRPHRSIHRMVRWFLKRSALARILFPHLDNLIYGRRWKPRPPPDWIDHRRVVPDRP